MRANSVWGFFGLAVTLALARLAMLPPSAQEEWGPRISYTAWTCLALSILMLVWPLIKRRLFLVKGNDDNTSTITSPALSIIIGHDGHYVTTESHNLYNITKTVLVGVKNTGNTFLSNCKLHYQVIGGNTNASQKWLLADSFSLNQGEERYIGLASYNEPLPPHPIGGDRIQMHGPVSGGYYDAGPPQLPLAGGAITLMAISAESRPCEAVCKLWVQDGKLSWNKA